MRRLRDGVCREQARADPEVLPGLPAEAVRAGAASQAKKAARVAQRLAAPAAKPKPAPEKAQQPKRETLRETVRRLCRENARREARGEKPLTYGQWELERWMAQRRGKK